MKGNNVEPKQEQIVEVWISEEPPALPVANPDVKPLWEALR